MKTLPEDFWTNRYKEHLTGWDIGYASTPLTTYINSLENKDQSILIPGCGNAYEAEYLMKNGFQDVTLLDISEFLVNKIKQKFYPKYQDRLKIIHQNFFDHDGKYDLILEQTFLAALPPTSRNDYAKKMHELLKEHGKLAGVIFNREFEKEGPPFGGTKEEYQKLFAPYFEFEVFEEAKNSIPPRMGSELFLVLRRK